MKSKKFCFLSLFFNNTENFDGGSQKQKLSP
jgi:hypothetical protein